MLDPAYNRKPRDFSAHHAALVAADQCLTLTAMHALTDPLGLWPRKPALMEIPMFNLYLQVRHDTLHVFDGGITMRMLILMGNWIVHEHGEAALQLANERLAALPRLDDFTHFDRPLWAIEDDANAARAVKMAAFWRCTEYEQMISQIMCAA